MGRELIRCSTRFREQLIVKSEITGRSIPELLEYAVFPFIPPKKKMFGNKKGNFADISDYLRFAIGFIIIVGFSLVIINNFDDNIQAHNTSWAVNETKTTSSDWRSAVPVGLDYIFLFGILLFFIVSVIFARLIPSSPKFIIITFFLLILFGILGMFVENLYDGFIQQTAMSEAFSAMTFAPFILNNFAIITILYTLSIGIALYTKGEVT